MGPCFPCLCTAPEVWRKAPFSLLPNTFHLAISHGSLLPLPLYSTGSVEECPLLSTTEHSSSRSQPRVHFCSELRRPQIYGASGGKYVLPCAASDWAPAVLLPALASLVLDQGLDNLEQEHFDVLR